MMPSFASSKPADDRSTELEGLVSHSDDRRLQLKAKLGTMVRFGPVYAQGTYKETEANKKAKDSAWRHILETSGESEEFTYLAAVARVERDALEIYNKETVHLMKGSREEFRKMMLRDGCFFLQLALHILGAGHELLGYPSEHPYFGEYSNSSSWIPAMFFVENQIPHLVIDALMRQNFFQEVIRRREWKRPAEYDVARLALYQMVVEPHLSKNVANYPPSDILVGLHNMLLVFRDYGKSSASTFKKIDEFDDLETGSKDDTDVKIPSARRLQASGIKLVKGKAGIRNIRFKNFGYSACLYVPPLFIDSHTEQLLSALVEYEQRSLNKSQHEVTAYLRFMRDLIPTYKDFKILERGGIIIVQDFELKRSFNRRLHNIVSLYNPIFTPRINEIRLKISDYEVVPWRLVSFICSIACGILTFLIAVLTIIQTVITVLSYTNSRT